MGIEWRRKQNSLKGSVLILMTTQEARNIIQTNMNGIIDAINSVYNHEVDKSVLLNEFKQELWKYSYEVERNRNYAARAAVYDFFSHHNHSNEYMTLSEIGNGRWMLYCFYMPMFEINVPAKTVHFYDMDSLHEGLDQAVKDINSGIVRAESELHDIFSLTRKGNVSLFFRNLKMGNFSTPAKIRKFRETSKQKICDRESYLLKSRASIMMVKENKCKFAAFINTVLSFYHDDFESEGYVCVLDESNDILPSTYLKALELYCIKDEKYKGSKLTTWENENITKNRELKSWG